jgi:hypothetical protein
MFLKSLKAGPVVWWDSRVEDLEWNYFDLERLLWEPFYGNYVKVLFPLN